MNEIDDLKRKIGDMDNDLRRERKTFEEDQTRFEGEERRLFSEIRRGSLHVAEDLITRSNASDVFNRINREILDGSAKVKPLNINYTPPEFKDVLHEGYFGHGGGRSLYLSAPQIGWLLVLQCKKPEPFDLTFDFSATEWSVEAPYQGSVDHRIDYLKQVGIRKIGAKVQVQGGVNPENTFDGTQYTIDYKTTPSGLPEPYRWIEIIPHPVHGYGTNETFTVHDGPIDNTFAHSIEEAACRAVYNVIKHSKRFRK